MTHGKSVVVPVEPTEDMMLAGALVGPDTNNGQFGYDDARTVFVAMLAAAPALSPEAPARVVKACADFQEAIDYFEAEVADALAEDSERADLWDREVTVNIDALKTVMRAALTPRHEAPADKDPVPSEWTGHGTDEDFFTPAKTAFSKEAPAEVAGEALGAAENLHAAAMIYEDQAMLEDAETVLSALRARSSAPEAREGGQPVGQVNALYASGFGRMRCIEWTAGDMPEVGTKLYTHPAAPSDDKLRIAVEALLTLPELKKRQEHLRKGIGTATDEGKIVLQALATLKAEGA